MTAAAKRAEPVDPELIDHYVYLRDVSFREYEALLAMRGERSVPRITYLHGVLELMSPSRRHETDKKKLARLVEAWGEEVGVKLEGFGSWTLKNSREERGAEPDECYVVNRLLPEPEEDDRERPDFAIEVIWTSGGLDKLEVYRRLGVREVWIYERGALTFFLLRGDTYASSPRSELLPALDPELIVRCMAEPSQSDAVRALRSAVRG
jgi:Uma2 family endonuclease